MCERQPSDDEENEIGKPFASLTFVVPSKGAVTSSSFQSEELPFLLPLT